MKRLKFYLSYLKIFNLFSLMSCSTTVSASSNVRFRNIETLKQSLIKYFEMKLNSFDMNNNKYQYGRILKVVQDSYEQTELAHVSTDENNYVLDFIINPNKNLIDFFHKFAEFDFIHSSNQEKIMFSLSINASFAFKIIESKAMELISDFHYLMQEQTIFERYKNKFKEFFKIYTKHFKNLSEFINDLNIFLKKLDKVRLYHQKKSNEVMRNEYISMKKKKDLKLCVLTEILNDFVRSKKKWIEFIRILLTKDIPIFDDYYNDSFYNESSEIGRIYYFRCMVVTDILYQIKYKFGLKFLIEHSKLQNILNENKKNMLLENFYLNNYFNYLRIRMENFLKKEDEMRLFYKEIDFTQFHKYNIYYNEIYHLREFLNNYQNTYPMVFSKDLEDYFVKLCKEHKYLYKLLKLLIKEVKLLKNIRSKFILILEDELRNFTLKYRGFMLHQVNALILDPLNFDKILPKNFNVYNCYSFLFQARILKYEAQVYAINKLLRCIFESCLNKMEQNLSDYDKLLVKELALLLLNQQLPMMPTFEYDRLQLNTN
ncbi:hypothetical protein TUBRATIS_16530 [Tubulinosema ratisbonensis]|uniref:Lipoprotein n=1 Tax=Tubulinosema ratisbonensis TaxID=291195 RepID=A0A437AL33_9MICR|nr:hypothetical protein TUBRATIS_16530 [Tubulinosema ratisbonensis]